MGLPLCGKCDKEISKERVEEYLTATGQLPQFCQACDPTRKHGAYMDYGHKTGGELVVFDGRFGENKRRAERVFKRRR